MKITYTGRQVELAPAQLKKLEAQFAKTGKLLDGKGDCEIHVVHFRAVTLGEDLGSEVEILSGLQPGELVVSNPSYSVQEGASVDIRTR